MSRAQIVHRAFALLLFAGALAVAVQLVCNLNRVKELKTDRGEINNVAYGLLDADQWVTRLAAVVERRVNEFELTEANRPQIKRAVEQVLNGLVAEVEKALQRRNHQVGGSLVDQLKGALQQGVQDLLIDFADLHRKVPQYAERVVQELAKPEAKRQIKEQLLAFMQAAAGTTFAKTDRTGLQSLMAAYGCATVEICDGEIGARIAAARLPVLQQLCGLFALVGLLFAVCVNSLARREALVDGGEVAARLDLDPFRLFLLTGATLILLAGGILSPMIEIEARIAQLSLEILGEPVSFINQVLYFQTKSIFDVVSILARTGAADMMLVAALLVVFSIIFPALKVVATYAYYYDYRGLRGSPPVRFFALRSGKWSMADVMVIAIFMAYIGFSGLVGSQLGTLRRANTALEVLTTNGTALAPGFFLFLGFVLTSLLLSTVLENRIGVGHMP